MAVPEYRQRLTRAALQGAYEPPPNNAAAWDAIYRGMPFVLAVDMDLRRIDAALELADTAGCSQIAIAALPGQVDALLASRYRETGRARVFDLTDQALEEVLDYLCGISRAQSPVRHDRRCGQAFCWRAEFRNGGDRTEIHVLRRGDPLPCPHRDPRHGDVGKRLGAPRSCDA